MNPVDTLSYIDEVFDLTALHAVVSVACSLLILWLMLCRTRDAGIGSGHEVMMAVHRVALAGFSLALLVSAFTPTINDDSPWAADVLARISLLVVLTTYALSTRSARARLHIARA